MLRVYNYFGASSSNNHLSAFTHIGPISLMLSDFSDIGQIYVSHGYKCMNSAYIKEYSILFYLSPYPCSNLPIMYKYSYLLFQYSFQSTS